VPSFVPSVRDFRDQTLMVIMPHPWKGGFFRVAAAICNALDEMEYEGSRFRVILGVPADYDCTERYLLNPGVSIEQIGYEIVAVDDARYVHPRRADRLRGLPLITPARTLPFGDTGPIGEVDAFILLSALYFEGAFVSRKPYAVYVADMIQRYVPEIYSDSGSNYQAPPWKMDRNQRAAIKEAACVFATTEQTMSDVLHYGGVDPARTMLFPMFAMDIADRQSGEGLASPKQSAGFELKDLVSKETFTASPGGYFLWVTNAAAHKNHVNAFRALRHYYEALGGQLDCLICGPVTDMLIPGRLKGPYHAQIYKELREWKGYNEHVKVLGYLPDQAYLSLLRNAKFLWHNVIYDNGTFSIIEAASLGTPVLSSAYPQIEFIDEAFKVGSTFFDARDPIDAAMKIQTMESQAKRGRPRKVGALNQPLFEKRLRELLDRMFRSTEEYPSNEYLVDEVAWALSE
jgi:glycosyltransferase involved in cell wall biosynthesis